MAKKGNVKLVILLLFLSFLLSVTDADRTWAKDTGNTVHKVKIELSGTGAARVTAGRKNIAKKILRIQKGDVLDFSHAKDKKIKSVTCQSMNKKCVAVSKKGKRRLKRPERQK